MYKKYVKPNNTDKFINSAKIRGIITGVKLIRDGVFIKDASFKDRQSI